MRYKSRKRIRMGFIDLVNLVSLFISDSITKYHILGNIQFRKLNVQNDRIHN